MMKATTCVRVVLPTDELVRVECAATMTVADLMRVVEKRSNYQTITGLERRDYVHCEDNNCDPDPATEMNSIPRSKGFVPKLPQGRLTLVRMESELQGESLVVNEVEEFDILEFQLTSSDPSEWAPQIHCQQPRGGRSPIVKSCPHKSVEAIRPMSTVLIPSWQVQEDRTAREETGSPQSEAGTAESLTPPPSHSEVRLKDLIQPCAVKCMALRRRGARRHRKRRLLLFTDGHAPDHTKMQKYTERILLEAGMQLIDCIQHVQKDVRELAFLLRDAMLGGSTLSADAVLSLTRTMVDALTYTGVGSNAATSVPEDTRKNLVRRLSCDIAGKDGGVAIILEGWIVTAEWGPFWRSQRKEYACLCDNHVLYFFSSRTRCADFVFELGRGRDGSASETSKRLLKDNSPLHQIDISETDWAVRKCIHEEEESGKQHRNAFAFFDSHGRMRLVLDFSTAVEAMTWARLICAELSQSKLFARMREMKVVPAKTEAEEYPDISNPLTTWMEIMAEISPPIGDQHLIIPLHALYTQVDRQNGTARAERYKSWTLNQALKDLQRDRVKINGLLLTGASLKANILALTLEILRCTEGDRDKIAAKSCSGGNIASITAAAKEMTALRFARQVIICSSRTHGGGDILDTLHLLFGNERFCICPDARSMEPIEISISKAADTEASLSAQITIKMTYRVIPNDSIGPMVDQMYTNENGAAGECVANSVARNDVKTGETDQQPATEFKIIGTYSQRLTCHFIESNDIEGSIQLQFAG